LGKINFIFAYILYFSSKFNLWRKYIMAKNLLGKRPCSICRKWFQPNVRQKGRQKTCSPGCRNEHHRRQCEKWNNKNKSYFKNNYLADKIEMAESKQPEPCRTDTTPRKQLPPQRQTKPVLPCDIIVREYGIKNLIIIQYIASQVMNQPHGKDCRIRIEKLPNRATDHPTNNLRVQEALFA
jgi:hypothetical protein